MSSDQVTSRNEVPTKGATPQALPSQPFIHRVSMDLLALLPDSLSYSARLFIGFSLLTLTSALLVVYAAYENRLAYAELQNLERQQRLYDVEWGQLLLERSTLASPSRIEKIARDSLQMELISSDKVQVVDPTLIRAAQPPAVLATPLSTSASGASDSEPANSSVRAAP